MNRPLITAASSREFGAKYEEPGRAVTPVFQMENPGNGLHERCKSGERPIRPEEAAAFLKMARSTVLAMARAGRIPGHPITNGNRKRWLFFLSELESHVRGLGV